MNQRYGPCVYAPTLMYHHVQTLEEAKAKNQTSLTVAPDTFRSQMEYLQKSGYTTVRPADLIAFFDAGTPLPGKPVLLTFDDGYEDVGSVAAPIIREFGFSATGLDVLRSMNYALAFTTIPGSTLCRGQRLTLPRIRVGNSSLSAYGL